MKIVNGLIIFALLLISVVMIRLVFSGVNLPERPMVKWSQVDSLDQAGEKIARFLYPMLQKQSALCLLGSGNDSEALAQALKESSQDLKLQTPVGTFGEVMEGCYSVTLILADREDLVTRCQHGDTKSCVGLRAMKKLKKKLRSPATGSHWLSLYRVAEKEALLFIYKNDRN